jgi:hypothetical protein
MIILIHQTVFWTIKITNSESGSSTIFQRDVLIGGTYEIFFGKGPTVSISRIFYLVNALAKIIGVEAFLLVKEPKIPKRKKLMLG